LASLHPKQIAAKCHHRDHCGDDSRDRDPGSIGGPKSSKRCAQVEPGNPRLTSRRPRLRQPQLRQPSTAGSYRGASFGAGAESAASFDGKHSARRGRTHRQRPQPGGRTHHCKSMLQQALRRVWQTLSPRIRCAASSADAMAFQARVLNDLQRSVMKIRMVPVDQCSAAIPRIVRDVARQCDREVDLELNGQRLTR